MKPTDKFLAELWGSIDHYVGVRLTWDESAADVEEMAKVKSTIERLIAEREREARIEGVCKALYHTTALSDAEMRKRAEEWFDEERAR